MLLVRGRSPKFKPMDQVQHHSALSRRTALGGAIGILSCWPFGAVASDSAVATVLSGRYEMFAAGLHVADIRLDQHMSAGSLSEMSLSMKNLGLAALFGRHRMRMKTTFAAQGDIRPAQFTSHNDKPDRDRWVTMDYDEGGVVVAVEINNDGRKRPSLVPEDLWSDTIDPLTALARLQRWAPEAQPGEQLELRLFDGRKRADLRVEKSPNNAVMEMSLLAVFGFEEDEDSYVSWPGKDANRLMLELDGHEPPIPHSLRSGSQTWPNELRLKDRKKSSG